MKKLPLAVIVAGAFCAPFASVVRAEDTPPAAAADAAAPTPEHSFTGKVGLWSEYEYRGIAQSSQNPALQLNLDYAHSSGFYLGTFLSNIKWLKDTATANVSLKEYEYLRVAGPHDTPAYTSSVFGLGWNAPELGYS